MNTSNRHRDTTLNLVTAATPGSLASQKGVSESVSAENRQHLFARSTAIWGGVAVGAPSARAQAEIPQTSGNGGESQTGATRQQTPVEVTSWSSELQNVLDRPPASFTSRVMLGGLLFCVAFGAWGWLGQVEEVGHARGQLVPKGEVYKVHPVEAGKVASVRVKEGQAVKAGQVLLELDAALAAGEVERLEQMLPSYSIELSQKQTLLEKARLQAETTEAISSAELKVQETAIAAAKEKAARARQLLEQLQASEAAYRARKQRLEPIVAKSQALLSQLEVVAGAAKQRVQRLEPVEGTSQQLLSQLQANLQASKERVERLKPLVQEGAISQEMLFQAEQAAREAARAITQTQLQEATSTQEQLFQAEQAARDAQRAIIQTQLQEATGTQEQLFESEQALRDATRSIAQAEGEFEQANAQAEQLQAQLAQKQAEARRIQLEAQQQVQQLEVDLTELQAKIADTQNLINTAKLKFKQRFLYAPVDGVISALNVRNPGEVVQPGQTIAEMAPNDAALVLNASLPDREAGLLKTGMAVKLKFDAYPYQDYGVIAGTVTSISPDAKTDPQQGAIYKVEVTLESDRVTGDRQTIPFKAGQTATADIIIRRRRIADVLLDPIKKLQTGGINL